MQWQSAVDQAVGPDDKAGTAAFASRSVVDADPHIVIGRVGLHGRSDHDPPDVPVLLLLAQGHAPIVIGVKDELYAALLVFSVQLLVAKVVAYLQAAFNSPYFECNQTRPRAVGIQIARRRADLPGAEHLVVAVHDSAAIVDDVEAVVRLVSAREAMVGAKNDPQLQLAGQIRDRLSALAQQVPVVVVKGREIDPDVSPQTGLRKMRQMGALLTGVFHLAHDVFAIAFYIPADGKLASGNFQLHRILLSIVGERHRLQALEK